MNYENNNALLFLNSLVLVYDRDLRQYVIAGVEMLDCRVFGDYDYVMETSTQEWPIEEDEDYA